jgi:hypothetical protein
MSPSSFHELFRSTGMIPLRYAAPPHPGSAALLKRIRASTTGVDGTGLVDGMGRQAALCVGQEPPGDGGSVCVLWIGVGVLGDLLQELDGHNVFG